MMLGRCERTHACWFSIALLAWAFARSSCERRIRSLVNLATTAEDGSVHDREYDADVYRVLSYNICWGCMEADTRDKTGMKAVRKQACLVLTDTPGVTGPNGMGQNITQCALNMGKEMAKFYDAIGGYDLIGLQEASNAGDLLQVGTKDSPTMANMKLVEHGEALPGLTVSKGIHKGEKKYAWIAAMYNKDRLGEHDVFVTSKERYGRPYMILVFDRPRLIFINIHNGQPWVSLKGFAAFTQEMEKSLEQPFLEQPTRKEYRIVMTGDFNDIVGALPGCVEFPWAPGPMHIQRPLVKSGGGPSGRGGWAPGDFIFDSASTPKNELPIGYNTSLPQSDHWPVQAILSPEKKSGKKVKMSRHCFLLRPWTGKR